MIFLFLEGIFVSCLDILIFSKTLYILKYFFIFFCIYLNSIMVFFQCPWQPNWYLDHLWSGFYFLCFLWFCFFVLLLIFLTCIVIFFKCQGLYMKKLHKFRIISFPGRVNPSLLWLSRVWLVTFPARDCGDLRLICSSRGAQYN